MKKIKNVLFVFILLFCLLFLPSCKPDGMLNDTYKLAKQAISVMEDYHDFKITSEQADERLKLIQKKQGGFLLMVMLKRLLRTSMTDIKKLCLF